MSDEMNLNKLIKSEEDNEKEQKRAQKSDFSLPRERAVIEQQLHKLNLTSI